MTPEYSTKLFNDFFTDSEDFLRQYKDSKFFIEGYTISDDNTELLYCLLLARYGNSPIVNKAQSQFLYRVWSTIYQYGPMWEKKMEIQCKLRNLTEDELTITSKTIANTALNPESIPGTSSLEELLYINNQNTNTGKLGKVESYLRLETILNSDYTDEFINRFAPLFKKFVEEEEPLLYIYD